MQIVLSTSLLYLNFSNEMSSLEYIYYQGRNQNLFIGGQAEARVTKPIVKIF